VAEIYVFWDVKVCNQTKVHRRFGAWFSGCYFVTVPCLVYSYYSYLNMTLPVAFQKSRWLWMDYPPLYTRKKNVDSRRWGSVIFFPVAEYSLHIGLFTFYVILISEAFHFLVRMFCCVHILCVRYATPWLLSTSQAAHWTPREEAVICGNFDSLNDIHFQLRKLLEVLKWRGAFYLRPSGDKEIHLLAVRYYFVRHKNPESKKERCWKRRDLQPVIRLNRACANGGPALGQW
jgi:hypothetical protein